MESVQTSCHLGLLSAAMKSGCVELTVVMYAYSFPSAVSDDVMQVQLWLLCSW